MAKQSMIEREKKRARTRDRFAKKRADLKAIISNRSLSDDERWEAQLKLQALPRNASPVRQQRRCGLTGPMRFIENLVCRVTSCVKQPCAVMFQVW